MPRPDRDDSAYAHDMLKYARMLQAAVAGRSEHDLHTDEIFRYAVERMIEIVGEAARRTSDEYREQHSQIPWRAIVAQRHVLAHEYGEIDLSKLWRVASKHVPDLIGLLEPIIPEPPNDPEPDDQG